MNEYILTQHLRPTMNTFGFRQLVLSGTLIASIQQLIGGAHAYATPLKERGMVYDWNSVSTRLSPDRRPDEGQYLCK
jgi:hypothetical protein